MGDDNKTIQDDANVKELKIGALCYNVVRSFVPIDGDEDTVGTIRHRDARITVLAKLSKQSEVFIILHEAVHGLFHHSGESIQDERLVQAMASHLFNFIRDNPRLISAIQDTAKSA